MPATYIQNQSPQMHLVCETDFPFLSRRLNYILGYLSEVIAAVHLKKNGFHLVDYRHKNEVAEIDIICCNEIYVLFAEVKFRRSKQSMENYLDFGRCTKIYMAAERFLQDFPQLLLRVPLFKVFIFMPKKMDVIDLL